MPFSQERAKLKHQSKVVSKVQRVQCGTMKIAQSKIALTVPMGTMLFSQERAKLKSPVRNSINGTEITLLFSQNRKTENSSVKNSIHSTMPFFPERGKTENTTVKNSVNSTQHAMLFS